ncbi:alpha/beta hydrolase family protein [Sorangium sp. So ce1000]|uniref:alpha/beta hydrolase family protein n=1 Tax=Sorangium sp. So ce1000 TaxID=3133325 RepID=UPI003F5E4EDE
MKNKLTWAFTLAALGMTVGACSGSNDDGNVGGSGGAAAGAGGSASSSGGEQAGATGGPLPTTGSGSSQSTAGGAEPSGAGGAGGAGGGATAGGGETAGGNGGSGGSGGGFTGTCTESKSVGRNVSGSGPHKVVVETNSDPGINQGTIYRPADLGGDAKYPIFVWGEGGCSRDGFATEAAMAEIASHGYFVVADGTPNNKEPNRELGGGGDVLLAYVGWAIAENEKPCSAYYRSIDTTKVAANGFSCGGLMAAGTAADPRMTTWGHTSSGSFSVNQAFYNSIHTPVLIVTGTADSLGANENGARDFDNIAALGDIPVMMFAKVGADHGGDLWARNGGEFTQVNLAWLNWWLKGDESATGKGMLVGANCRFCSDKTWKISSANLP